MKRRVTILVVALAAWVGGSTLGTTPIPHAQAQPFMKIGAAHSATLLPALDGKKPIFILALGTDTRAHNDVGCGCADSIHLIGINPRNRLATVLGFPRDSWVEIPGRGMGKINTALHYGGPKLMVDTIESITGIHIDFYVLTTFGGLTDMVNSVGGVTVNVPYPMHGRSPGTGTMSRTATSAGPWTRASCSCRRSPSSGPTSTRARAACSRGWVPACATSRRTSPSTRC